MTLRLRLPWIKLESCSIKWFEERMSKICIGYVLKSADVGTQFSRRNSEFSLKIHPTHMHTPMHTCAPPSAHSLPHPCTPAHPPPKHPRTPTHTHEHPPTAAHTWPHPHSPAHTPAHLGTTTLTPHIPTDARWCP